jgi:hypothetical protein
MFNKFQLQHKVASCLLTEYDYNINVSLLLCEASMNNSHRNKKPRL